MQYSDDVGLLMLGSQAEFAVGNYPEAARLLRKALTSEDMEKYGVPVPVQLYTDERVWEQQIDKLLERQAQGTLNPELNLLAGYQLLARGDAELAQEFLNKAVSDHVNRRSAQVLLDALRETSSIKE